MISENCHLCNCELFPFPILELKGMPRAAQYFPTKTEFNKDLGIDLKIYQCSSCGLVQLNTNPVDYFKEVITAVSFSEKTKSARLNQMKAFIKKYNLLGKKILEIGSGKGEMLDILDEAGFISCGLEASPDAVKNGRLSGRNMINGYISEMVDINNAPFDAFISFNYLEHLPNPGIIIRKIYEIIIPDGIGYVTVPNLEYLLETKCLYEFVADHLSYFTMDTLSHAFFQNGFNILDCGLINNDNDIEITVKKRKNLNISKDHLIVESLIKDLQIIISEYKDKKKKVAVWGAGHRTLALLALSKLDDIEYIVDSAKFKQGNYTPVLHLNIVPPDYLKEMVVDLVIIMVPGVYPSEVMKTLTKMNIDSDIALLRDNKIEFIKRSQL